MENNLVTDHRGDPAYADWDVQAAAFDKLVEEMKGKYFGTIEEERNQQLEREEEEERQRREQQ